MTYDYEYFACVCSDEARAEAEAHLQRAYDVLEADATNLLSRAVMSLQWDISSPAYITQIACDMWSGIWAETYERKPGTEEPLFNVMVQCDVVEHGIAVVWNAFYDRFKEEPA
jgi:hypothetical protein